MYVQFYTTSGDTAGGIYLKFNTALQYQLYYCISYTDLPTTPPSSVNKIWRITLSKTSGIKLKITCNGVEVLNLVLSDTCSIRGWNTHWNRDVGKIKFASSDSATDEYRPG